jgi:DNA-binding MarR family transcriptional regulator
MKVNGILVSLVVLDILDALDNAAYGDPAWGLRLCKQTGHDSGTVYPALTKLLKAGWITDRWEKLQPADRPRRRYYDLTEDGRAAYLEALAIRAAHGAAWAS